MNPNPRIGVLLRHGKASVRLFNVLNPLFGRRGLIPFQKEWPEARLRRECRGYGPKTSAEWQKLLANRPDSRPKPQDLKHFSI
jgi:hypothetical protein